MPEATVLVDSYRYYSEGSPEDPQGVVREASKGDTVDVSQAYFDHGVQYGQLAKPGSSGGLPSTHADLDAFAAANDHTWSADDLKVADKQAELQAAGLAPAAES
jgi:hypothetical protein